MLTQLEQETLSLVKNFIKAKLSKPTIDWEQRRYEIARDMFSSILSKKYINDGGYIYNNEDAVKETIKIADLLIAELKKPKEEIK